MFEVLFPLKMRLGESPLWDHRDQSLCWIDIQAGRFYRWPIAAKTTPEPVEWQESLGAIALLAQGGWLMASASGLWQVKENGARGELLVANPESHNRFNDGRCDPLGGFWVGTLDVNEQAPSAALYRWDGRALIPMKRDLVVSNGLAFSPDGRWLYHADSASRSIERHAFDRSDGSIGPAERWVELDHWGLAGAPDGAAIDEEGSYWCALYGGSAIVRFSSSGRLIDRYPLPCRYPTMVAFGGADLRTLYVTSASVAGEREDAAAAGALLVMDSPVKGRQEEMVSTRPAA